MSRPVPTRLRYAWVMRWFTEKTLTWAAASTAWYVFYRDCGVEAARRYAALSERCCVRIQRRGLDGTLSTPPAHHNTSKATGISVPAPSSSHATGLRRIWVRAIHKPSAVDTERPNATSRKNTFSRKGGSSDLTPCSSVPTCAIPSASGFASGP
jgi:hypothetical protein